MIGVHFDRWNPETRGVPWKRTTYNDDSRHKRPDGFFLFGRVEWGDRLLDMLLLGLGAKKI